MAGDEYRVNDELRARFFDAQGQPRDEAFEQLKTDLSTLMLPSRERALALDKAYLAIVREPSFTAGRDAILRPARPVWDAVGPEGPPRYTHPLPAPRHQQTERIQVHTGHA